MAQTTIVHRGYHGSIVVNNSDYSLSGKILFIEEEIRYRGTTFAELEADFQQAVDSHIQMCIDNGKQPPFTESGEKDTL